MGKTHVTDKFTLFYIIEPIILDTAKIKPLWIRGSLQYKQM